MVWWNGLAEMALVLKIHVALVSVVANKKGIKIRVMMMGVSSLPSGIGETWMGYPPFSTNTEPEVR